MPQNLKINNKKVANSDNYPPLFQFMKSHFLACCQNYQTGDKVRIYYFLRSFTIAKTHMVRPTFRKPSRSVPYNGWGFREIRKKRSFVISKFFSPPTIFSAKLFEKNLTSPVFSTPYVFKNLIKFGICKEKIRNSRI